MKFSVRDIPITIAWQMQHNGTWTPNCPVGIERLKLAEVGHYDFEGKVQLGQIVVLDKLAEGTLHIFEELMAIKFPIHKIKPIDEFAGNDWKSMAANNSSCFNFRTIPGSDQISMHSYGLAIDINPVQNPFIVIDENNNVEVYPKSGVDFLNRTNKREGMVEPIVSIFKKHGFSEWGGDWNKPIDYHHFQTPRDQVQQLIG